MSLKEREIFGLIGYHMIELSREWCDNNTSRTTLTAHLHLPNSAFSPIPTTIYSTLNSPGAK